eukprot:5637999-Alexandrium_andersonii.AAC.1
MRTKSIWRRGAALVSGVARRAVEQLEHENRDVPFSQVLSERVFASSALVSINGSTPRKAVF